MSPFNSTRGRGDTNRRIVLLGLDAAGKTTVLNYLAHGEQQSHSVRPGGEQSSRSGEHSQSITLPTIGFNLETVHAGGLKLQLWDVGGQSCLRNMWLEYLRETTDAVIFVVDACDSERLPEARRELQQLLQQTLGMTLLVLANKQDLPGTLGPVQVAYELEVLPAV